MTGYVLGTPRLHLRLTDSTNSRAKELAAAGAPHGTLVSAAEQSAGRGRQGRTWIAPAGQALLCSLILRPPPSLVSLRAGVAVAELAEQLVGAGRVQIKWPNDVLLDGRKVAGILAEGRPQEGWVVLGIGLNVAIEEAQLPPELRTAAGTLGQQPSSVEPALAHLLAGLAQWLGTGDEQVLAAIRARDALAGRPVNWAGGEGTASGIDSSGRLVVLRHDGSKIALDAGEVHLR
jgi:BirA family biotin operon repressor/biotin-[acetyl-CoA-carboxylase] ligase